MKLLIKFISLFILLVLVASCGADKLKPKATTNQFGLNAGPECSFTSGGAPVCGMDGKDYINKERAECTTTVKHVGHCQCLDTFMVCGSDGLDHNECEARSNTSITIIKYVPCAASEY